MRMKAGPLSDRGRIALSIVAVVVIVLLLILAAEGVVRVRQYIKYGAFSSISKLEVHSDTGLRIPEPGMTTAHISINSLGFRGPEIEMPKPESRLRIGFIGASTTYCAEVSSNDAVWTELVSRKLESSSSGLLVDYVNGGVPGYTTTQSLLNLEKRVLPLAPDVLVIYHATNDLSGETRRLAESSSINTVNLATEESWLGGYSLLWYLVEKNIALMMVQSPSEKALLAIEAENLGSEFRQNLEYLVDVARSNGVALVALATFSIHLRPGMSEIERQAAMVSARYYMPYLSADDLLAAFERYNQIVREVALKTGALLIEGENGIPGDPIHFVDSVHFTDAGSRAQAQRIATALEKSAAFQEIAATKLQR
jgi:lysophospholipase L1-like esterase